MLRLRVRKRTDLEQCNCAKRFNHRRFVLRKRLTCPVTRSNVGSMQRVASRCPGAHGDRTCVRHSAISRIWERLAAETEADGILSRALAEIELGEPYEALPLALNLRSKAS